MLLVDQLVRWKFSIFVAFLMVAILAVGLIEFMPDQQLEEYIEIVKSDKVSESSLYQIKLSLEYFNRGDVVAGRPGDEESDTLSGWKTAVFNTGYRSFPTTTIALKGYKLDIKSVPPLPSDGQLQESMQQSIIQLYYDENYKKFGELVRRYAGEGYLVTNIVEADVTGDGVVEQIVSLHAGGNHAPFAYEIVSGAQIIFSMKLIGEGPLLLRSLVPADAGNGFTLSWQTWSHHDGGLCCPIGHTATRFTYSNGEFIPVYEQEELYFEVKNSDTN
jgi:hypothetical protein